MWPVFNPKPNRIPVTLVKDSKTQREASTKKGRAFPGVHKYSLIQAHVKFISHGQARLTEAAGYHTERPPQWV